MASVIYLTFLEPVAVRTETARQLEAIARREGHTVSRLIRELLADFAQGYMHDLDHLPPGLDPGH